jgi:hypothetical protein
MTDFQGPVGFSKRTIGPNGEERVSPSELFQELRKRGFAPGNSYGHALHLQGKMGTRKYDGKPIFGPVGKGITPRDFKNILATSYSASMAADRIVSITMGESNNSFEDDVVMRKSKGFSQEEVQQIVDAAVSRALAASSAAKQPEPQLPPPVTKPPVIEAGFKPLLAEDDIMDEAAGVTETPTQKPPKRKPGWPKGKPRGPRKPKPKTEPAA